MIGRLHSSYGADLSLRHGAVVEAYFYFGEATRVSSANLVYGWTTSSPLTLTEKSTPDQIFALIHDLATKIAWSPGSVVGIDYDDRAAYWTRRPGQVAKQSFLLGYFARAAHEHLLPTVFIPPQMVRRALGFEEKAEKNLIWNKFRSEVELGVGVSPEVINNEDARDALVLAYLIAKTQEQTHDVQHTVADLVSSGRVPSAGTLTEAFTVTRAGGTRRRGRKERAAGDGDATRSKRGSTRKTTL